MANKYESMNEDQLRGAIRRAGQNPADFANAEEMRGYLMSGSGLSMPSLNLSAPVYNVVAAVAGIIMVFFSGTVVFWIGLGVIVVALVIDIIRSIKNGRADNATRKEIWTAVQVEFYALLLVVLAVLIYFPWLTMLAAVMLIGDQFTEES